MTQAIRCWCGQTQLEPFSNDYLRCADCQTLVYRGRPAQPDPRVRDDAADFYGWEYFHAFQQDQNRYPTIETRARTDLHERCTYWLNALIRFKLPPARVLELGSAHGGFVALLRQAGYDATGLDLSPSVVESARRNFNVPILVGPVEDQQIAPGSLDVIALMDVLEHMPDPRGTMQHCLSLLKPDGLLIVQTPRYPEGKSFEQITAARDRFTDQFRPGEHLHLFSETSATRLFESIGAAHVRFLPPIFWFYDMFFVVSRMPLIETQPQARDQAFTQNVNRRFVQALLDGEDRFRDLLVKHRALLIENAKLKTDLATLESQSLKMSA